MALLPSTTFFHIIPPAFGLDVSDSSLKFVQMAQRGSSIKLDTFGERDIQKGIVEEGVVKDPQKLGALMKESLRGRVSQQAVVASIPDEEVFLSTLQLPAASKGTGFANAVRVEAEANIPIDLQDAYFDYTILPKHAKAEHIDVLATAVRKTTVDAYLEAFAVAGLTPFAIEPESLAIARSVVAARKSKQVQLLVEIGSSRTRLIIFGEGSVLALGTLPFSGAMLVEAVMGKNNVDRAEAIALLRAKGLLTLDEEDEQASSLRYIITPLIDKFAQETERYLNFFNNKRVGLAAHDYTVGNVLLSGGGSYVAGIENTLQVALHTPVERANPLVNTAEQDVEETHPMKGQSLRYAVAIGLAMRGIQGDVSEFFAS